MGNTGRHISSQGVGRDKMITMAFVRHVKNFINNFEVTGGHMRFDGVRARLTVDGGGGVASAPVDHPFQIKTVAGDGNELLVQVAPGKVWGRCGVAGNQADRYVNASGVITDITLTDEDVNYIELIVTYTNTVDVSGMLYYKVGGADIATTAVITQTSDAGALPADGTATRVVQIGTVTTADGVITEITQELDENYFSPDEVSLPAATQGDVLVMGATAIEWETPSTCA